MKDWLVKWVASYNKAVFCFHFIIIIIIIIINISLPANAAFVALIAAADGLRPDAMKKYAMSQINYILGDNNYKLSYMVGFGDNFPAKPHHRGR